MINEITYNKIKRIIRSSVYLNNGYQFDDLFHDTIEKLLIAKKTNKECRTLCVIIAERLLIDKHRKCKNYKEIMLSEIESAPKNNEEKLIIVTPVKNKEMFILRHKFGMKLREISEFRDININTVKSHNSRMKNELRRLNA